MAGLKGTTKRIQISKANTMMVAVVAGSAFIVTFSLVATRALWSQRGYQARVIKAKESARDQLNKNVKAAESLTTAYKEFVGAPNNLLGGNPAGSGERDGDNGRIVLDALPSKYDFPALATSMEKLLSGGSYKLKSISGTDDELAQVSKSSATKPEVVEMPFALTLQGSYTAMKEAVALMDRSIRPISVQSIAITADSGDDMTVIMDALTYYQPAKNLKFDTKVVK